MLSINTNLSSLITQNSMKTSTDKLNQAIERMSTGFKINHAKDNAANYSISTNMTTKMSAYQVAEDNVAMGLDMIATLSSSLDLIEEQTARIRDLCEQASNGANGEETLRAIQAEIDVRLKEIARIKSSTEYNGITLFEEKLEERSKPSVPLLAKFKQLSEEEAVAQGYTTVTTADELVTALQNGSSICLLNDIDMTSLTVQYMGAGVYGLGYFANTLNIEGNGYSILLPEANNLSSSPTFYFSNIKNAKFTNLSFIYNNTNEDTAVTGLFSSITGNIEMDNCAIIGSVVSKNFTGVTDSISNTGSLSLSNTYIDVSIGSSGLGAPKPIVYSTNDGILALNNTYYNSEVFGEGSDSISSENLQKKFKELDITTSNLIELTLQIGINGNAESQIKLKTEAKLSQMLINCSSSQNARNCLATVDNYLNNISIIQTELGSISNRLESALDEIGIQYENLASSRSTIRDADIAEESSTYIQQQILQQASATLLATANQSPAIALQLI